MEEIPFTLIRSDRRTISLQVERNGSVVVRAPKRMARREIDAFLAGKADWLSRALTQVRSQSARFPPLVLKQGAALPWLDGALILNLEPRKGVKLEDLTLHLPQEHSDTALERWCRERAREHFGERISHFSALMGVAPTGLRITGARTRWGSCTAKDSLNLTWRLMLCPRAQVDYVVVHELAHIRQKNHSPAFWREVEAVLPDWRERRRGLRDRQAIMDFL